MAVAELEKPTVRSTGPLHYALDADKPIYEWIPGQSALPTLKELLRGLVWGGHEVELVVSRPFDNHIRGTLNKGYESFADQSKKTRNVVWAEVERHLVLLGVEYAKHYTIFTNLVGPTILEAEQMKTRYIKDRHGFPFRGS